MGERNGLRARFLANREKVRSWFAGWECPEIEWPEFREVPLPWVVARGEEQRWLEHHAPFMDTYLWLLQARSPQRGISQVRASWSFGAGHAFDRLEIGFRSWADPDYLAEKLALGAHAAALRGWREEDVRELHAWLFQGLDSRPMGDGVRGQKRIGFVLCHLVRAPVSRTEIAARLRVTLTDTALDGSPLDAEGRTLPG
ncbi:hypothetical protein [Streptomyces sp. URMC 129]|uniref:hypothetical protein n=1 Tax=Streptomyces sp. URMC 129 TaxID=3423407 RepID=UPI003F1CAC7C